MGDTDANSLPTCTQCGRPAIINFGGHNLCVDHYLKIQQANYLYSTQLAAMHNLLADQLDAGAGYLIRSSRIELPRPPFVGDTLTLNNINVSGSNIGTINTGTIRNLDASITVMENQGNPNLAQAIKMLTEAVLNSNEIIETAKNEIAQQLVILVAHATAKAEDRSLGLIKSILAGLKNAISVSASLITLWNEVEPLFRATFGL